MGYDKEIVKDLLAIQAVQVNTKQPFTWTSGIQSPIYCDNRLTMSYPVIRQKIAKAFVQLIEGLNTKPDVIAGCATAGIPHAAWVADQLNLPMVYVRSSPKGHGKENQVEGVIEEGQNVVVIEDLISTGKSSIASADVLQQMGANVIDVLAIFSYGLEKATAQFQEAGLTFQTITNFDHLLDLVKTTEQFDDDDYAELLSWRQSF